MPATRGVKRTASKASSSASSVAPKNKKKRGVTLLDIPSLPKDLCRVVACGQGDVGQLGLGEDVMEATRYKYVSTLGDNIVSLCAGGMHSVALDNMGKVWTFGCNDEGALGRATTADGDESTPGLVALSSKAVRITAGDSHTAALLDDGHVYAWGAFRDSHGSMGLVIQGRTGKTCKEPIQIHVGEPAADIASGGDHLVVLGVSGSIYTMGCGEQGQLGRLAQRSASRDARQGFSALLTPSKVTLRGGASKIWAGYHATFAINAGGEKLLAWGLNNYGQLGISGEKRKNAIFAPTECDAFTCDGWSQISCGQHHSLAIDKHGKCHAIGRCEYGRLGMGTNSGDAETLQPIPKLEKKKCVSIAASTSSSYAITDNGEIFGWGMGSENQLGNGKSDDAFEPVSCSGPATKDRQAREVSAGGQHALVLLKTNGEPEPISTPMDIDNIDKPVTLKESDTKLEDTTEGKKADIGDDKVTKQKEKVQQKLDDVEQHKPEQNSTENQTKPEENKTEPITIQDNKTETTKMEDSNTETTKIEESKAEPTKIEDNKSEPTKIEENKSEQSTIEKNKTEQTTTEQTKIEQPNTELNNSEDVEMKEVKPEEVNGKPLSPEPVLEKTKTVQDQSSSLNKEQGVETSA